MDTIAFGDDIVKMYRQDAYPIRRWAFGRPDWLFSGSLRSGERAAAIMKLIQPARIDGHDPNAYLKDVLIREPPHLES